MSSSQQKSVFPGAYFELAANVNNELWSIGLSQLKLLNVTQQQVGALLVNGIQKHHQAHKEQVTILEGILDQYKNNQEKALEIFRDTFSETVEKLKSLGVDTKNQN